jgi:hypothetical protein
VAIVVVLCPTCGHRYESLVPEGTRVPSRWHCSRCGGDDATPSETLPTVAHPLDAGRRLDGEERRPRIDCACG